MMNGSSNVYLLLACRPPGCSLPCLKMPPCSVSNIQPRGRTPSEAPALARSTIPFSWHPVPHICLLRLPCSLPSRLFKLADYTYQAEDRTWKMRWRDSISGRKMAMMLAVMIMKKPRMTKKRK